MSFFLGNIRSNSIYSEKLFTNLLANVPTKITLKSVTGCFTALKFVINSQPFIAINWQKGKYSEFVNATLNAIDERLCN